MGAGDPRCLPPPAPPAARTMHTLRSISAAPVSRTDRAHVSTLVITKFTYGSSSEIPRRIAHRREENGDVPESDSYRDASRLTPMTFHLRSLVGGMGWLRNSRPRGPETDY